ncbi:hypothetical protein NC651_019535 [Populus alba x Populus x berolinensis]|nr:hypothetical protein NC651_019535 [Populus alba x Populus x berolinensis]
MDHQDFLRSLQGDEGFKTISDVLKQQAYLNFASLIETKWSRGSFEASVTLAEKIMAILEQDPEFLA